MGASHTTIKNNHNGTSTANSTRLNRVFPETSQTNGLAFAADRSDSVSVSLPSIADSSSFVSVARASSVEPPPQEELKPQLSKESLAVVNSGRLQLARFILTVFVPVLLFISESGFSLSTHSKTLRGLYRDDKCADSTVDMSILLSSLLLEARSLETMADLEKATNSTNIALREARKQDFCHGSTFLEQLSEDLDGARTRNGSSNSEVTALYKNITVLLAEQLRLETDRLKDGHFWEVGSWLHLLPPLTEFILNGSHSVDDAQEVAKLNVWMLTDTNYRPTGEILRNVGLNKAPLESLSIALQNYINCVLLTAPSSSQCFREFRANLQDLFPDSKATEFDTTVALVLYSVVIVLLVAFATLLVGLVARQFRGISTQLRIFTVIAATRSDQLTREKERTEKLVYQMLPRAIADQLKTGKRIEAESFEDVSIYFSDVVGFNEVALTISPILIVDLLNTLYGAFDECIEKYDAYKVETIADSYLMVSGLPDRNGHRHSSEIAAMALDMMKVAADYSLPGSTKALPLRIGINSGPIVAGVVGLKNTRYCLFGDTINTASRMQSTGEAYRIHTSEAFMLGVQRIGGFIFEARGTINVKGKGSMKTFWLTGTKKTD